MPSTFSIQITQLKIASNPFAKGFRDCDPDDWWVLLWNFLISFVRFLKTFLFPWDFEFTIFRTPFFVELNIPKAKLKKKNSPGHCASLNLGVTKLLITFKIVHLNNCNVLLNVESNPLLHRFCFGTLPGSISVSEQLPTYPSPNSATVNWQQLKVNVGLGEG